MARAVGSSKLAAINVTILDNAAFLFVPPAPSSTIIKSDVVKSAPMSEPPSISNAVNATLPAVDSTAAELNIVDGNTSATSTTLADADRLVTNDNGTMVQVALSDVKTYLSSAGFSQEDPTALAIALG